MKAQLDDYYVFCQVAKFGSMKAASERINLPLSTVSRRIVSLEESLGLQLFVRSKNKLTLSNEGEKYFKSLNEHIEGMLNAVDELNSKPGSITGRVVISTTKVFYFRYIHDAISTLLHDNPGLTVELKNAHSATNLGEDIDIAIVNGPLPESSYIARKLIDVELSFVSTEQFYNENKNNIDNGLFDSVPYIATFSHPSLPVENINTKELVKVNPSSRFIGMDIEMVLKAVSDSLGYAILPYYHTDNYYSSSDLITIFSGYELKPVSFSILYRSRNLQSVAQRAVIDSILQSFNK
ncbi:LysR family transcriptional regulator [Vibrio sp. CyArs1]|uniref:LysR family transcriptional regulator n=1 Tax=Vibrio sp. CyArs1 TaxID=2682577 RepID=UPI001F05415B|nr:LysR family transcriptional regulator [Vibrio sp. CyArs1]